MKYQRSLLFTTTAARAAIAVREILDFHVASRRASRNAAVTLRGGAVLLMFLFCGLASTLAQSQSTEGPQPLAGETYRPLPRNPVPRPILPVLPAQPVAPASPAQPSPLNTPLPQPVAPVLPPEPVLPAEGPIGNPEVATRYFVDVTTFGARSDPYFDNTGAIQAAINSICARINTDTARSILFFPPGYYVIYQPQQPSTSPALTIPCSLEMQGAWTIGGAQWALLAHGSEIEVHMGANPNGAAAILINQVGPILRNLTIEGGNQAVALYGVAPTVFENVCLDAQATGLPDNTPLKVTDSFWVWFKGGCLQAPLGVPVAMFTAEIIPDFPQAEQQAGLVYFSDMVTTGDGFKYIQRARGNVGDSGVFVFRNISMENATDVFEISQTCVDCANWEINALTFDNVGADDSACVSCSVVNMNAADGIVSGIVISNSYAGNGGDGRAITVNAGRLVEYSIAGCRTACVTAAIGANGVPLWTYSGKVTLADGSDTVQFFPVLFIFAPPVCVVNDETTLNGAMITTTLSAMTITGGPSDVVDYACFNNEPYPVR
jgi:Pectate lyase superfamily protein